MLALPKKTDYALIALSYLLEHPGKIVAAREIAEAFHLPCALLMNVMKELQQGGMVRSVRGAKGGYQLSVDPAQVTLYDVVRLTSGEPHLTECCGGNPEADTSCSVGQNCPIRRPLRNLHDRLMQFLKEVRLMDIISSRHIDVPVGSVGLGVVGVS